jgi:hypothetical protein
MAGSYPDAIGPRVPYDRNGSVGIVYDTGSGTLSQLSQSQMTGINDESSAGSQVSLSGGGTQFWVGFIFPTPIDFMGYFILWRGTKSQWTDGPIQVSTNTTNFMDGTWTQIAASHTTTSPVSPGYRNAQTAVAASGIKAIRFRYTSGGGAISYGWAAVNLYGKPSTTTDRLELWHPTLDQPLTDTPAYFDYGDVSRGTGAIERDFRIKNLSSSLTASTITVGVEALTDASPTYVSQTQFRYNGGVYGSSASLGALGPGSISLPFTAKLDTLSTAALGLWAQRYYAQAAGWS